MVLHRYPNKASRSGSRAPCFLCLRLIIRSDIALRASCPVGDAARGPRLDVDEAAARRSPSLSSRMPSYYGRAGCTRSNIEHVRSSPWRGNMRGSREGTGIDAAANGGIAEGVTQRSLCFHGRIHKLSTDRRGTRRRVASTRARVVCLRFLPGGGSASSHRTEVGGRTAPAVSRECGSSNAGRSRAPECSELWRHGSCSIAIDGTSESSCVG